MNEITTIPKIYRLGDRHTIGILEGAVVVEEKYDGSQFAFGTDGNGNLVCRSKNTEINIADPGMFKQAIETAQSLYAKGMLMPGAVYQCEFLAKPKHNVLKYSRTPVNCLVLFDIRTADRGYVDPTTKCGIAVAIGLEPVQTFHSGGLPPTQEWLDQFLTAESSLGGCKVEGVVIKNYAREHDERPGHPQTAKVVSEAFKEVKTQQCAHVGGKADQDDRIGRVTMAYRTEARWLKAVQHLREAGKLTDTPKDIVLLLAELWQDIQDEETDSIKDKLFELFARELRCSVTKGFPEWYLSKLQNGFTVFETEEMLNKVNTNTKTNE